MSRPRGDFEWFGKGGRVSLSMVDEGNSSPEGRAGNELCP